MREIKFRGKRINNGEWVYGYYLPWHAVRTLDDKEQYAQIYDDGSKDWILVYAETVGQYIGSKDKNGVEIYEGDIVKASRGYLGEVDFESFICAKQQKAISDDIEVIGNIYDNPELLEERI